MSLRLASLIIISLFSVALLAAPALGISVSVFTGDGSGVATSSSSYSLDDSTSLNEEITLEDKELQKSLQASGTGKNEISQQMTGGSSSLQSSMISQGSLDISSSGYAWAGSASLGVGLSAQGDLSLSGQASQGQAESGQEAGVADGLISTSQSLTAGQGVSASQSTDMAGLEGCVSTGAVSKEMALLAMGSFSGQGTLSATLTSSSAGDVNLNGQVSTDGALWLKEEDLQLAAEQSGMITVQGIRSTSGGLGSFETKVANFDADALAKARPDQVTNQALGGSSSSYVKKNWRWNARDPRIQLYLREDQNLWNEGLTSAQAQAAIANAANTWDGAVAQNLFADAATVIIDGSKNTDNPYDGYNVHAWKSLSDAPGAIAYSRTRTNSPTVDGYQTVYESDVSYSTDYSWSTTGVDGTLNYVGNPIDLHTVAMHELGHTLGLGDLYNLPDGNPSKSDSNQVMNNYNDVQRTLGNGDLAGVQALYRLPGEGSFYGMSAPYTTIL